MRRWGNFIGLNRTRRTGSRGRIRYFIKTDAIYANQDKTSHLKLKPFFGAAIRVFVYDLGFSENIRTWLDIGRDIRQNSWQIVLFFRYLILDQ